MYATPEQLARRMGNYAGFDADETARATELLEDATGVIDDEVGHSLVESTDTVICDGSGAEKLLLPRHPVSAVIEVVEIALDGTETTLAVGVDYTWSADGILTRLGRDWPRHDRSVRAQVTAGFAAEATPATVRKICLRLGLAGWENPAGAEMEDVADHRVRWNTPGMELTSGEKRQLDPWRVR